MAAMLSHHVLTVGRERGQFILHLHPDGPPADISAWRSAAIRLGVLCQRGGGSLHPTSARS
jgi:hypothetical protein